MANAFAAVPVVNVYGTSWVGTEVFTGRLQKFGAVRYSGAASLTVDSGGSYIYLDPDGIQFTGLVVQTGRRLRVSQDPSAIAAVETQLANIIVNELNDAGIDPGTVSVSIIPSSIRLTAKLRTTRAGSAVTFTSNMRFTAQSSVYGARKGSFSTRGVLALISSE